MTELIITNGDGAVDLMRKAGFAADILPWRDVLHEGPVPETTNLETLSAIRAGFLAEAFGQPQGKIEAEMMQRDRTLADLDRYDQVTIWLEHDLYDQLQLLQLLDFFHREAGSTAVHLVQADDYLGLQTPERIRSFASKRAPASAEQKALSSEIFRAFQQSTPLGLAALLDRDLTALPHMKAALIRLFEDLPDSVNGLSRTQRQALDVIDQEGLPPRHLFGAVQKREEVMFMGDWSFWLTIEELAFNRSPLVAGLPCRFGAALPDDQRQDYLNASLSLTDCGRATLAGEADHAAINDIDRWLGGTHITKSTLWRWNHNTSTLLAPT